jgi:CRISPR-associated endonuclease Csn1
LPTEETSLRVLGLDLGTNSVGWALVTCDRNAVSEKPTALLGAGARIFEAGMEGEIDKGKEVSRNKKRRDMRLQRRQAERRARRDLRVARTLQAGGLLPPGDLTSSADRHAYFQQMDMALVIARVRSLPKHDTTTRNRIANTLPYQLRAQALDGKLEAHELGRALYHLGQRRGFESNRKDASQEDDDEKGKVYAGIERLADAMAAANCATLGQYFASFDPSASPEGRIRNRYTHRSMYKDEFERIWEAQATHHPDLLTPDFKQRLHKAIFFQRPLKSASHLIGICQYESRARGQRHDRRRAPWALEVVQRFRILQNVNNLVLEDTSMPTGEQRKLTPDERAKLIFALDRDGDMSFANIRKMLFGKNKFQQFTLERGGEKKLPGNRTAFKLRAIFGERWDAFSDAEREAIVEDLRSFEKEAPLMKRAQAHWKLDPEAAKAFAKTNLEPDYCNLSRQAIAKLMPHLEEGLTLPEAVKLVYSEALPNPEEELAEEWTANIPAKLPPVDDAPLGELRNPTVYRMLSETRHVVNAVIHQFGKPDIIRIELGRDVKRNKKQRAQLWDKMRQQEKRRAAAKGAILKELGRDHPSRDDVEKMLLLEECGGECPYTGKSISIASILGDAPQFEVEHIIPFSRCLDNSFLNKTLCYHEVNRAKGNRTPAEAFSADPAEFEKMLERIKKFKGDGAREKLRRFQLQGELLDDFIEGFTSSQLNDTRYASRLAAQYCQLLFPRDNKKHVQVGKGGITSELRAAWKLNGLLGDGTKKSRDDHRHHAIDAVTIALASPAMVKTVSEAAQMAVKSGHKRWWKIIQEPWPGFISDVGTVIDGVIVSHAGKRKVKGALHKETIYSPQKFDENGKPYVHIRKALASLSSGEVDDIVDKTIRNLVRERLTALGIKKPTDAFTNAANRPSLVTKDGRQVPINKVRIRVAKTVIKIGMNERTRAVAPLNHHMEILEITDARGKIKWTDIIVDQVTAWQRRAAGQPIVQRGHGEEKRFVFSIAPGDFVIFSGSDTPDDVYVVRGISKDEVTFVSNTDSRLKGDIVSSGQFGRRRVNSLRDAGCRKVTVTPTGEIRWAND